MLTVLDKVPAQLISDLNDEFESGKNYLLTREFKDEYSKFQKNDWESECIFGSGYTVLKQKGGDKWLFPNFYFKASTIVSGFLHSIEEYSLMVKDLMNNFQHVQQFLDSFYNYVGGLKVDTSWTSYANLDTFLSSNNIVNYVDYLAFLANNLGLSNQDALNFSNFVFSSKFRLGAKNPININGGPYFFRPDTFGSVVGKIFPINPTKHGNIISRITEELYTNKQLYNKIDTSLIPTGSSRKFFKTTPINKPNNRIIYGAPGTGKSYRLADETAGNRTIRITFNPEMTYGQFVGAYKPIMVDSKVAGQPRVISYELVPGKLLESLVLALKQPADNIILIIEEINRANVAAVFGDVFQLLDRNDDNESEYSISFSKEIMQYMLDQGVVEDITEEVRLPSNLYLWATMNSADQGVFAMDSAFKRRWSFEYIGINDGESADGRDNLDIFLNATVKINWNKFRRTLNEYMIEERSLNIAEDKLLGPFFLSKPELGDSGFAGKLLLYLWDDVLRHKNRSKIFRLKTLSEFHSSSVKDEIDRDILIKVIFSEGFAEALITELDK